MGNNLENTDLWKVMWCVLEHSLVKVGIQVGFRHVPTHVGVYGNERADRLAKVVTRQEHTAANRTVEQRIEKKVGILTDSIVVVI